MLKDGRPIGAISMVRRQAGAFAKPQIELVKTFAAQAVIAIENARLFEAEQVSKRELQESLEYQTAISDVLNVISRSPTDVQPVFDMIAKSAMELCHAEFCNVFRRFCCKSRARMAVGATAKSIPRLCSCRHSARSGGFDALILTPITQLQRH
jgi:hypothetical protein